MVTSDGLTKIGRKFKGSLPSILNKIADAGLEFNKKFPRKFIKEYRCIALAFNGSRLVGFGKNKKKTHTFTKIYHDAMHMSIHAEADLVMQLIKNKKIETVTDIVIIRGTTNLLNSYPCEICEGLIKMYFFKIRVWFFDADKNKWLVNLI